MMPAVARRPVAERLRRWLIARCAPISIDGQTVEAITIDGEDVREVTMDGDTVFENAAIPDSAIDNFDEILYEDKSNTLSSYYSGDLSYFSRVTTPTEQGSHALECDADTGGRFIISNDGDGLPRYPQPGETIRFLYRDDSGSALQPVIAASGSSGSEDGYGLYPNPGGDEIVIARYDDASFTQLASTSVSFSQNTWYWLEAPIPDSGSDTISLTLYEVDTGSDPPTRGTELASVSSTDDNYSSSNLGLRSGATGVGYVDYFGVV